MTFLQLFTIILVLTFAYGHVMFRVIHTWHQEDRVLRQSLAGVVCVGGHVLIRDEKGADVMYFDDYYTLPYRPGSDRRLI